MSANTSFQALCLSVRATASDSNPAAASFNHLLLLVFLLIIVIESLNGEPSPRRAGLWSRPTIALSSCTRHQRLITVPAHYGSFPPPQRHCCCPLHAALLHILRETSARPNARSPARTKRSCKKRLVCKKRNGQVGSFAGTGGSCPARSSLGQRRSYG